MYETIPPHIHKTNQIHIFITYLSTWKCIPRYFEILKSFSKCNFVIKVCIGILLGRTLSLSVAFPGSRVISMLLTRGRSFKNLSEELLSKMSHLFVVKFANQFPVK